MTDVSVNLIIINYSSGILANQQQFRWIIGYSAKLLLKNTGLIDLLLAIYRKSSYVFIMESFWNHCTMATLTIKNMPDILYQDLKEQAMLNHRSLNSEAIVSLALVVHKNHISAHDVLLNARALRIKANVDIILTDKIINYAKQQGRL